jgi:hypothetical protein
MGALLKVAGRVGEGALDAVEDAAKDTAGGIVARIRSWWAADSSASGDLERFEAEPDVYEPVVQARLVKKLTAEPGKQAEFAALMEQGGPQVEVFQAIASAHGITGAKIKAMTSGRVQVDQRIQDAGDVKGVDIERLG